MSRANKRKCTCCKAFFTPCPQSKGNQRYCSAVACRQASKRHSQKKWLCKPENKNYFKGAENVSRVRLWRRANPGYWRRSKGINQTALQDTLSPERLANKGLNAFINAYALQDMKNPQSLVLLGLIAKITESALQDDIAAHVDRLLQLGRDITTHYALPLDSG